MGHVTSACVCVSRYSFTRAYVCVFGREGREQERQVGKVSTSAHSLRVAHQSCFVWIMSLCAGVYLHVLTRVAILLGCVSAHACASALTRMCLCAWRKWMIAVPPLSPGTTARSQCKWGRTKCVRCDPSFTNNASILWHAARETRTHRH